MGFSTQVRDGDNVRVVKFVLNAVTGLKVSLANIRILGWTIASDGLLPFLYSDSLDGEYILINSGSWSGSFTSQGVDTIGWFKSQTGNLDLYVLFSY